MSFNKIDSYLVYEYTYNVKNKHIPGYFLPVSLITVTLFSLILNVYGIKWGLPDSNHFHPSFHPDETASLESSILILSPKKPLYPSPTGLGNGPMQFYLMAFIYNLIYGSQLTSILNAITPEQLTKLYLIGRILTIIMSAGCVLLVFFITRKLFNHITGFIAALFFAILPATVTNSHYFRPDIPTCFWILLTFFITLFIFKSDKVYLYILGGVFAGFAVGTKYNSVLILLPLLYAHIVRTIKTGKKKKFRDYLTKNLLFGIISFSLAFAISSPGIFLYWGEFTERVIKQIKYQTGGTFMDSMELGPGWIGYLIRILPFSLGWPMLIISISGIIYAFWRRTKFDILILLWLIPYYLLIGRSDWWVVRYTVPLLPFFTILGARTIVELTTKLKKDLRVIPIAVGFFTFAFTLLFSFKLDKVMVADEPRHTAYDWLDKNISADKKIGFDFLPQAFYPCINERRHQTVYMQMNQNNLNLIDYYVANDQIYLQYIRLAHRYPAQARYFKSIFKGTNFKRIVQFENSFNLLGFKFKKVDIPHDYMYFMPRIEIYEKIKNF